MVLNQTDKSSFNGARAPQTRNSSINARSQNVNGHVSNDLSDDEQPYDHGSFLPIGFRSVFWSEN